MKTKPFLLATAGSTIDGRVIDDKVLKEIASSYDPKTYAARLNIEHVRGVTPGGAFGAYGDVLELSTGEVDVNFNGKIEKRTALYGVFEVTPEAKKLNDAKQKMYPSIEIEDNFGGKGFAYLAGCALTDSPAALATQRLQFNRQRPDTIHVAGDTAYSIEFAEEADDAPGDGFLGKLSAVLDSAALKFGIAPKAADPKPEPKPDDQPAATLDFAQLRPMFEEMGTAFAAAIIGLEQKFSGEFDQLGLKVKALEEQQETTPANTFIPRPRSDGKADKYAGAF